MSFVTLVQQGNGETNGTYVAGCDGTVADPERGADLDRPWPELYEDGEDARWRSLGHLGVPALWMVAGNNMKSDVWKLVKTGKE